MPPRPPMAACGRISVSTTTPSLLFGRFVNWLFQNSIGSTSTSCGTLRLRYTIAAHCENGRSSATARGRRKGGPFSAIPCARPRLARRNLATDAGPSSSAGWSRQLKPSYESWIARSKRACDRSERSGSLCRSGRTSAPSWWRLGREEEEKKEQVHARGWACATRIQAELRYACRCVELGRQGAVAGSSHAVGAASSPRHTGAETEAAAPLAVHTGSWGDDRQAGHRRTAECPASSTAGCPAPCCAR